MLIERFTFNMLAFGLLIIMTVKMIRRSDISYLVVIGGQALGITVNFLELVNSVFVSIGFKIFTYTLSVIIPSIIVLMEIKKVYFPEAIYMLLSKIAYLFRNYKLCKKFLDRLITVCPVSYYGHKMLAEVYEKEGGLRKAIDEYARAIEIKPQDFESHYKIGVLLEELNKKDEAITILNNLLRRKPDHLKAANLLGIILCDQERYKQAINTYHEALKYHPGSYELYYNLAIVHTRLNDFKNAKECYEKAAEINSLLYNAHYSLGQIYLIYHDLDAAESAFMKCLDGEETESKAYYQLAKLSMLKGEKDKGLAYINHAIQLDGSYVENVKEEPVFETIKSFAMDEIQANEINVEQEIEKREVAEKLGVEAEVGKNLGETLIEENKIENIEKDKARELEQITERHLDKTLDIVDKINETSKLEKEEKSTEIEINDKEIKDDDQVQKQRE